MTTADRFKDFVRRQQREVAQQQEIDWKKEKDEWLAYLTNLYMQIKEYLSEYVQSGAVLIQESNVRLHEDPIGTYEAKSLTVSIGSKQVRFKPIGTLLIGTKGRVDVEGSAGSSRLVLINKTVTSPSQMVRITIRRADEPAERPVPAPAQIDWVWKIVSKPPAMQFVDLNKDSFLQMILEISNG